MLGSSVGYPRAGSLFTGYPFPPGAGYAVRHPERAWATRATIEHVQRAIERVRMQFAHASPVLIGDLSYRTGGPINGHRSHQSGRDVDIGFFHRSTASSADSSNSASSSHTLREDAVRDADRPDRGLAERAQGDSSRDPKVGLQRSQLFQRATRRNLQIPVLLEFIVALAESHDEPSGVEWIMLDYRIQEWLVDYGERSGYDASVLSRVFQVPHGPNAPLGLVRHYPGHMDHLHLRFKCPPEDRYCASPSVGPAQSSTWSPAQAEDSNFAVP
jgi:hypothetical protein